MAREKKEKITICIDLLSGKRITIARWNQNTVVFLLPKDQDSEIKDRHITYPEDGRVHQTTRRERGPVKREFYSSGPSLDSFEGNYRVISGEIDITGVFDTLEIQQVCQGSTTTYAELPSGNLYYEVGLIESTAFLRQLPVGFTGSAWVSSGRDPLVYFQWRCPLYPS